MRLLVLLALLLAACGAAADAARSSRAALESLDCDEPATFGVLGGARADSGVWNPQPTDVRAPLQAWLDACAGRDLVLPAGAYYVRARGGGAALAITHPTRLRAEPDAVLWVDGDDATDVLLLEFTPDVHAWSGIRPVDVAVTIRGWHLGSGSYRHGIVSHVAGAYVHDSQINEAGGWGVLVESGTAGNAGLEGATRLPQGMYVNSNFSRLERLLVADDGDQGYPGDVEKGGGVRVHGSDANGIEVADSFATYVNVGFDDGSLEGVTWRRDYVEVGGPSHAVGFRDDSSGGARYFDCREEIATPSVPGPHSRAFGGYTLFAGTPAATVDGLLRSVALPLRNTQDRWQWRQRGVTLPPGATVVRSAPDWNNSSYVMRPDMRVANAEVQLTVTAELPAVDVWDAHLSPQAANAQTAARAAQLLALDVSCGAVAVGYQDSSGGLALARCENGTQAPVVVDLLWAGEVYARSSANTGGP
jgi:hypothetical protein